MENDVLEKYDDNGNLIYRRILNLYDEWYEYNENGKMIHLINSNGYEEWYKYDDKGNASYGFYTHRCKEGMIEIPAKTPDEMFEEDFIPNDLGYIVNKMNEYYN